MLAIVFASFGAALLAHVLIDVLGDVLLAHDTYDDLAHGSRGASVVALAATALVALGVAVRAALTRVRGDESALLEILRRAAPRASVAEWLRVTAAALPLIVAMEAWDAFAVGRPCDDLGDLLGGSLPLGIASAAVAAVVVSSLVRLVLRRLVALHGALVSLVAIFVDLAAPDSDVACSTADDRRAVVPAAPHRKRLRGRAPPHAPSLGFIA